AHKRPEERGRYRVLEDRWILAAPKNVKHSGLYVLRVFVWSSADAAAAPKARAKKLDRARVDLDALERGLGGRLYPTPVAVQARLTTIATKRRVGDYLRTTVGTDATGKPTLRWHYDQDALAAEAATDGWYCLLTNLDPAEVTAGDVLARYKGQEVVERRYGAFKGPLAVAPVFLKNNRRIEALLSVICLALLIFCLVEREVRRAIAPDLKMTGFPGRPTARPTGRLIFDALARLHLIPATANAPPIIPAPTGVQARLLELLDVDPLATR
ncbi:MAG: IS1634 family transposase, partial [Nocardioidaceae bacterium]